jgi:hypothetical protein
VGEEEDDDQVQDRRHAQGEGEALHVTDREHVEDRRGEEADRVGREDRATGTHPAPGHRRPEAAPLSDLVLEPFEVDDERVRRDAQRDDEAGDAGQAESEADLPAEQHQAGVDHHTR